MADDVGEVSDYGGPFRPVTVVDLRQISPYRPLAGIRGVDSVGRSETAVRLVYKPFGMLLRDQ
jgi:hypothetical protein